ncbi:MAG: hypothetical protein R3D45_05315 [Rhizobiaceae bacterium]
MSLARDKSGFMLLEMLVALSVVAVMGALMTSFLGQLGSINRLEAEIAAQTELDAAVAYLQRTLEGTRSARLLEAEPDTNPLFDGQPSSIRFAAVARRGLYSLALRDVHVFTATVNGHTSLEHTFGARRLANGKPVPHGPTIPILDRVSSVTFEYSDGSDWSNRWSSDGALPRLVKIRIEADVGNKTIRSEAVARIF